MLPAGFPLRLKSVALRPPGWAELLGLALLLKKCWLLLPRFGMEPGFTCRFVGWKLSREGDTGLAPVIKLAWWKEFALILDCCIETRSWPN